MHVDEDHAHSYEDAVVGGIYEVKMKLARPDLGDPEVLLIQLHLYEEEAVDKWRSKWIRSNAHIWTWKLIEDAATFPKMKRNIKHYTVQLLTGHGIFNTYRVRINKETVDKFWYCDDVSRWR